MSYGPVGIERQSSAYPANIEVALGKYAPEHLDCIGDMSLLAVPRTALLCSGRLPGEAASRGFDIAQRLRARGRCVVSGFHSPMEKQCLEVLLRSANAVIVCPARGLGHYRVPLEWRAAIDIGRLLVLSCFHSQLRRGSIHEAVVRNRFVAALADELVTAYASEGGKVARVAREATRWGRPVHQTWDGPIVSMPQEELQLVG